jgi:hypothetical protein
VQVVVVLLLLLLVLVLALLAAATSVLLARLETRRICHHRPSSLPLSVVCCVLCVVSSQRCGFFPVFLFLFFGFFLRIQYRDARTHQHKRPQESGHKVCVNRAQLSADQVWVFLLEGEGKKRDEGADGRADVGAV